MAQLAFKVVRYFLTHPVENRTFVYISFLGKKENYIETNAQVDKH